MHLGVGAGPFFVFVRSLMLFSSRWPNEEAGRFWPVRERRASHVMRRAWAPRCVQLVWDRGCDVRDMLEVVIRHWDYISFGVVAVEECLSALELRLAAAGNQSLGGRSDIVHLKIWFCSFSPYLFSRTETSNPFYLGNMQLSAPLGLASLAALASAAAVPLAGTSKDIQFCTASTYATGACPYAQPTAGAGTCGTLTVEANVCCKAP